MSEAEVKRASAKKGRKRRRRVRRNPDEPVFYELRVNDWDYYYGFRVSDPKSRFDPGPYSEISTLTFKGAIVSPEGFKYQRGEFTFSARAGMLEERYQQPPSSIGSLSAYGETLSAYVFVPAERFAEMAAVAASGRIQVASIIGTKLRYRSGLVQNVSLNTEIEEDEEV